MFHLAADPRTGLIESTLADFFSVEEVLAYSEDAEALIARASRLRPGYRMLIDVSGCAIQSQAVIGAFAAHVGRVPPAKRLAVVTGSSIIRMQIRRILGSSATRMFEDRADALAWLDETAEARAA